MAHISSQQFSNGLSVCGVKTQGDTPVILKSNDGSFQLGFLPGPEFS